MGSSKTQGKLNDILSEWYVVVVRGWCGNSLSRYDQCKDSTMSLVSAILPSSAPRRCPTCVFGSQTCCEHAAFDFNDDHQRTQFTIYDVTSAKHKCSSSPNTLTVQFGLACTMTVVLLSLLIHRQKSTRMSKAIKAPGIAAPRINPILRSLLSHSSQQRTSAEFFLLAEGTHDVFRGQILRRF